MQIAHDKNIGVEKFDVPEILGIAEIGHSRLRLHVLHLGVESVAVDLEPLLDFGFEFLLLLVFFELQFFKLFLLLGSADF